MIEGIRNFALRIWDKIEDHLAKYIAGILIVCSVAACLLLWEWSFTKHSLKMYGWLWVVAVVGIILLSVLFFWLITKEGKRIVTDETDIKNELNDWWKRDKPVMPERRAYGTPQSEFVIHCRSVDRHRSLKKGSAAKLLPEIIENDNAYCIKSKGKETIVVQRKD